jgi:hypothetical protein
MEWLFHDFGRVGSTSKGRKIGMGMIQFENQGFTFHQDAR